MDSKTSLNIQKVKLHRLPLRAARARRNVERDHAELSESRLQIPPLGAHGLPIVPLDHPVRLNPAEQGHTAVALFSGVKEITMIALGMEGRIFRKLVRKPRLLQTQHVRTFFGQPVEKALLPSRAQAVTIQRSYPHPFFLQTFSVLSLE